MRLYSLLAKKTSLSGGVLVRPGGIPALNLESLPDGRQACESRASILTTEEEFGRISIVDIVQRKKQNLYLLIKDTGFV
jgi:hypothetical protein